MSKRLPLLVAVSLGVACQPTTDALPDAFVDSDAGAADAAALEAGALDAFVDSDAGAADAGGDDAQVVDGGAPPPLVADALDCGRTGAGGLGSGNDASQLQRHELDLGTFPDAVCNDGTRAVMYFRPHIGDANRNRWVIQLQGGGGCSSAQACADRWCRVGTNFGMNTMTANGTPPVGIDGNGILSRRADNPMGDWNQVFVKYCSSDTWAGTSGARDVEVTHPVSGEPVTMRLHFNGRHILEAVVGTLRRESGTLSWDAPGESVELDDLEDAAQIALVGASAGGNGVIHNLDWFRDEFPAVPVRGVIDSAFPPAMETLDFTATTFCAEMGLCDYESYMTTLTGSREELHAPASDGSCLATHPAATAYQCDDVGHVVRHHITTPFLVRMGLTDSLISAGYIDNGFGRGGVPFDLPRFATAVRDDLRALTLIQTTAEEGAAILEVPSAYGISCDKHETLRSNSHTYDARVRSGGADIAFPTVLSTWSSGSMPSNVTTDAPPMDTCPAP